MFECLFEKKKKVLICKKKQKIKNK